MSRQLTPGEIKRMFPNASKSTLSANETHTQPQLPDPEPKPKPRRALEHSLPGKEESLPRVTVRFIGYRVRPIDPDNFAGSCKDLLDGLRHAALIRGDEPWRIRFETEQCKVAHYAQEKTVIEIEPL